MTPTGRVTGIIKRDLRTYVGELLDPVHRTGRDQLLGLATLSDSRLPRVLLRLHSFEPYKGKKLIIAIDDWPEYARYPFGHLVRVLG